MWIQTSFQSIYAGEIRRYERQVLAVEARAAHDRFDLTLTSWYAGAIQLAMRFAAIEAQRIAIVCVATVNDPHGGPGLSAIAYTESA